MTDIQYRFLRYVKVFLYLFFCTCFTGQITQINGQPLLQKDNLVVPVQENIPDWLHVGNLSFSRLDGGYIELQKAKRTKWGQGWQEDEYQVLENIYLTYSEDIIRKLKAGGINVIWVTWSNGWSLQHEAGQRDNLKVFIDRCHRNDIKVIAYICSSTIFWENMFLDYPISFDITRTQSSGIPYTYHGENPLRFLADLNHPEWIKLQKKRVEHALDAGIDGFFFDNPLNAGQPVENQVYFFNEIQKFIKEEKDRPEVPVTSNFGLQPEYQPINRQLDFVFNEFGRQPGVYEGIWMSGNIKKIKYIRSFLPAWKTTIHEANYFPGGLRERSFMPPKAQKLARAEAVAFGAVYVNFIEGRMLTDLIHETKEAMEMWDAVGLYNRFINEHAGFYTSSIQPHDILVLIPGDAEFSFDSMEEGTGAFLDFLSRNNVLYQSKLAGNLQSGDLANASLLILPDITSLDPSTLNLINSFKAAGGKIAGIGGTQKIRDVSDKYYPRQFLTQLNERSEDADSFLRTIDALSEGFFLNITNATYTLGNITAQKDPDRMLIHLINYDSLPEDHVSVRVNLKSRNTKLKKSNIRVFSPDSGADDISDIRINGSVLEFNIPRIDTYTIITIN